MSVGVASRYRGLATVSAPDHEGRVAPSLAMRPNQSPSPGTALYRHRVTGVENIEYLAWKMLGSSEAWWRVADANGLRFPLDLAPGDTLNVAVVADGTPISRERVFA